jgi:hypothetical protein
VVALIEIAARSQILVADPDVVADAEEAIGVAKFEQVGAREGHGDKEETVGEALDEGEILAVGELFVAEDDGVVRDAGGESSVRLGSGVEFAAVPVFETVAEGLLLATTDKQPDEMKPAWYLAADEGRAKKRFGIGAERTKHAPDEGWASVGGVVHSHVLINTESFRCRW